MRALAPIPAPGLNSISVREIFPLSRFHPAGESAPPDAVHKRKGRDKRVPSGFNATRLAGYFFTEKSLLATGWPSSEISTL